MYRRPRPSDAVLEGLRLIFLAGAFACMLSALHRIAGALTVGMRVEVLERLGDTMTAEEREGVLDRIKKRVLGPA